MLYSEAIKYIESQKSLIGSTNQKGFIINELVIVPTDPNHQRKVIENLILKPSNKDIKSIPFNDDVDVQVWAIDTEHLVKAQILFYDIVAK